MSPPEKKARTEKYKALYDKDFPPLKNKLIFQVIKGEKIHKVPVWIMRQAGRYLPEYRKGRANNEFFKVCQTPELACEVTLQPIDRYGDLLDASIIFSDIMVVPQAMGLVCEMVPGKGPTFPEPIRKPEDLKRLTDKVNVDDSLGYVFDAITLTRQKLDGRVPLFGFSGGPWTLMAYMIEGSGSKTYSKAKAWLYNHPKDSKVLLQKITDVIIPYLVGQLIQLFESNSGELSPQCFTEFVMPYIIQIVDKVKEKTEALGYNIPVSIFARGSHYAIEELSKTKFDIIQVDWTMDPKKTRETAKAKVLQGNADPSLLYGSKETIYQNVEKMIEGFGVKKYIANLGHGMYPDHDPEHLKYYLEAIRDVSSKKLK
ncbi:hypothetical protein HK103_004890 [Boothiomyces macroporosus]|uniref:Uroporphyrinogen decarboxylase n=1 Tax=Boothiomyces macroporosus TaxID=261099 RepID=A0AAD5Y370_9FUNG|nr:hypothetical protein HK103_004890 [Boothiomyces macroporosus]